MDEPLADDKYTAESESSRHQPSETHKQEQRHKKQRQNREHGHHPRKRQRKFLYNSGEGLLLCSFYTKVGACRHYGRCTKRHIDPTVSNTIKISNLYPNPLAKYDFPDDEDENSEGSEVEEADAGVDVDVNGNKESASGEKTVSKPSNYEPEVQLTEEEIQEKFDLFYKDVFTHISKLGEIKNLVVCENVNNHLNGNVYVQFVRTQEASEASKQLNSEWFNERPVYSTLSPVRDFEEAYCHEYSVGACEHGERCNYMHLRYPTPDLEQKMYRSQEKSYLIKRLARLKEELPNAASFEANGSTKAEKGSENHNRVLKYYFSNYTDSLIVNKL